MKRNFITSNPEGTLARVAISRKSSSSNFHIDYSTQTGSFQQGYQ